MAENENTAQIANKIAVDIFQAFHWELYAQNNSNFDCVLDTHLTDEGKKKLTHPGDVVFHYFDPYSSRRVFLHTDLKSYKKSTIQIKKIRSALTSLALTVECANISTSWRKKFKATEGEPYEVRGMLFVANHDNKAKMRFSEFLKGMPKSSLPIAKGQILHVLGPVEISNLYSIATDIRLSRGQTIGEAYRFFYPDLTLWKSHVPDDMRTGATIEMLLSPYFILKHTAVIINGVEKVQPGTVVYYGRQGNTIEEFVYLLDALSRHQLVNSREQIRVKAYHTDRSADLKNNFDKAKHRYCAMWKFEGDREEQIMSITIDGIQQITANYVPDEIGWKA